MDWFRNATIQRKLLSAFVVIALVGIITTGWNIYNSIRIDEMVYHLGLESDEMFGLEETQLYLLEQELATKEFLLTGDEHFLNKHDEYDHITDLFMRESFTYASSSEEIEDLNELDQLLTLYRRLFLDVVDAYQEGEINEAVLRANEVVDIAIKNIQERFEDVIRDRRKIIHTEVNAVGGVVRTSILAGVFSLGVFALLALLASAATQQVTDPVLRLTNAVVAFENASYESEMLQEVMRRRDEMGHLAIAFDRMAESINEANLAKDHLLEASSRFVPYEYLEFLQKPGIETIKLGDHVSADMAVMFSDIRSFTTISESMTPQENFDFVNMYLSQVSPVIRGHDGFVVKFLGDGMMAIFPYGVDSAVQAGIEKSLKAIEINAERAKQGQPPIQVGVGIHTGHMMVGMIGEENRMQGDAFSDNVNLTARVEGLTKYYAVSIIITEETYMRLEEPGRYHIRYLGKAQVKGRERPIGLYEVYDADPEEMLQQKIQTQPDFDQGVKCFIAGRMDEAKAKFENVLAKNSSDKTATFYLERTISMMKAGVPDNWEGVEVMRSK